MSKIEELNKSLYERNTPDIRTRRKLRYTDRDSTLPHGWDRPPETPVDVSLNQAYDDHSMSFFTKLLIGSVLFCLIAIGIGAYVFFNGTNLISANNIEISISGPISVPGGEPVSFDIQVTNKNNVDLELVDLSVDFPAGTVSADDTTQELRQYRELIGNLARGESHRETVQATIFGEENARKEVLVTLTYSVKGSTSTFTKTKSYEVLLNSSPISIAVSSVKQVISGQQFMMDVKIKSNSDQVLRGIILKASYPFGFTFVTSNVKPLADTTTWKIGDIPAGAERTIQISGTLQGEDNDARTFRFNVGAQSSANSAVIGTEYTVVSQDISIEKPFISLTMNVDGDGESSDAVVNFDDSVPVEIEWFNNLPVPVTNAVITVKLSGTAYDRNSVRPSEGDYRSYADEISWNQRTTPGLASIEPGGSGRVIFYLTPRDLSTVGRLISDPTVRIMASVRADRPQESNVSGAIEVAASRTIRVASSISFSGRVVRSVGPFMSTGPVPPKVNETTSYTIVWTVDNTSSALSNAQVTATIPSHVNWLGNVSPANELVTYEQNSGTITWNIGNVSSYTVQSSRRREVSFQVSIRPSISQLNQVPILVNQATLSAVDTFTNSQLQSTQDPVTIRFSTDPTYREGQGTVVE